MLMHRILFIFLIAWANMSIAQDRVTFKSSDSLDVVAHLYQIDSSYPYILLFHQENYSKGEYKEIAISLLKLKYNCLAVDLRYGGLVNSVPNETAANAVTANLPRTMYDAYVDIEAAINYAYQISNKEVLVMGSSYSGALALKISKFNPKVKAVIAYSPGEFFRNKFLLQDELDGYDKPIYIAGSQVEYTYLQTISQKAPKSKTVLFQPQNSVGKHGAKSLWKSDDVSKEYWLSLLMFINNLKVG